MAPVGADLVDQARDADARGAQRDHEQQRAHVAGERIAENDHCGRAGDQADK